MQTRYLRQLEKRYETVRNEIRYLNAKARSQYKEGRLHAKEEEISVLGVVITTIKNG